MNNSKNKQLYILLAMLVPIVLGLIILGLIHSKRESMDYGMTTGEPMVSFTTNHASVGDTLTARLSNVKGAVEYKWYVRNKEVEGAGKSSYTVDTDECFVEVRVYQGGKQICKNSVYISSLPVVYINTFASKTIADEYTDAHVKTTGSPDFGAGYEYIDMDASIKLRGNSTRNLAKQPYKLKLAEKSNLYGMGSNRHWVLLANAIDHTYMRNKLTYDLAGALGMDYCESVNVSLVLNGSYAGVYQLCEQIRIASTRVDIFSWEDLAKDAAKAITDEKVSNGKLTDDNRDEFEKRVKEALQSDYSWASPSYYFSYNHEKYNISDYVDIPNANGGYILEMDFYNNNNPDDLKTAFNQPFYFSEPDGYAIKFNLEVLDSAQKLVQSFEYAVHSADFIYHNNTPKLGAKGLNFTENGWKIETFPANFYDASDDGKHYSEIIDVDSLVNNWIICEFAMNWDSMKNSVFVYKDVDSVAKLSPVWDFDWAYGNANMYGIDTDVKKGWHTTNEYFTREQSYQSLQWNRYLVKDPFFLHKAYTRYLEIRDTYIEDIIKDGGLIDSYKELYQNAGLKDDAKWSQTWYYPGAETNLVATRSLKSFIKNRVNWLDKQFVDFDTFVNSIGYYKTTGDLCATVNDGILKISCSDASVKKVSVQINGAAYHEIFDIVDGNLDVDVSKWENAVINVVGLDAEDNFVTYEDKSRNNPENAEAVLYVQDYAVF